MSLVGNRYMLKANHKLYEVKRDDGRTVVLYNLTDNYVADEMYYTEYLFDTRAWETPNMGMFKRLNRHRFGNWKVWMYIKFGG